MIFLPTPQTPPALPVSPKRGRPRAQERIGLRLRRRRDLRFRRRRGSVGGPFKHTCSRPVGYAVAPWCRYWFVFWGEWGWPPWGLFIRLHSPTANMPHGCTHATRAHTRTRATRTHGTRRGVSTGVPAGRRRRREQRGFAELVWRWDVDRGGRGVAVVGGRTRVRKRRSRGSRREED